MQQTKSNNHNLILIQAKDELCGIITPTNHKSISLNVETTGFDYNNDHIVGVSLGVERMDDVIDSYYIPLRHKNYENNIDTKYVFGALQKIINTEKVLFYNRPFAFFFLEKEGLKCELNKTNDIQIMLHLATNKPSPSRMEYARMFIPNIEVFDVDLSQQSFDNFNPENAYIFSAQKTIINILLAKYIWREYNMIHAIYSLDNKSNEVVRWFCKTNRMPVDYDFVQKEYDNVRSKIENIRYQCRSILGYDVNVENPQARFEALKRVLPINGDIDSFNDYQLDDFNHPIAKLFKQYSELASYESKLKTLLSYKGNPLKIRYSTVSTSTGRFSSGHSENNSYFSNFNIQNVNKDEVVRYVHKSDEGIGFYVDDIKENSIKEVKCKGGLRDAFICDDDYVWVSCDYSGEEMCLLANFTREPNLIKPIQEGKDIHTYIAKNVFGIENNECRSKVKILNFSVVYGAYEKSIARKIGVSIEECKKLLEKYYKFLPSISSWKDRMIQRARTKGYVSTLFGRPRMLYNEYQSENRLDHYFADRASYNSPIQGCTPLYGHLELEEGAIRMSSILGRKHKTFNGKYVIPTHRSDNQPLFCHFKSGDYMICDNNHQLIYNNIVEPKVAKIRDGFKNVRVMLSPLRRKSLKFSKFIFKPLVDCKSFFTLSCKRDDIIKRSNKDMNSALFRLALSGKYFNADYDSAISMRSIASVFGYNVIYNSKKDLFKVTFYRRKKSKIRNIWWCFDNDNVVPMGSCTVTDGFQMYANQGFWNKNTGADIIRQVLCRFKDLFDNDKEWSDNVRFACTIHDECNFYVKKGYLENACKKIYDTMYFTNPLCVLPIEGKLSVGSDWGHLVDIELSQIKNNKVVFS